MHSVTQLVNSQYLKPNRHSYGSNKARHRRRGSISILCCISTTHIATACQPTRMQPQNSHVRSPLGAPWTGTIWRCTRSPRGQGKISMQSTITSTKPQRRTARTNLTTPPRTHACGSSATSTSTHPPRILMRSRSPSPPSCRTTHMCCSPRDARYPPSTLHFRPHRTAYLPCRLSTGTHNTLHAHLHHH